MFKINLSKVAKRMIGLGAAAAMASAGIAGTAHADVFWGTSFYGSGYWGGAQLWKVNTSDGNVNVIKNYPSTTATLDGGGITSFSAIAQTPNGRLYVTVSTTKTSGDRADYLAELNSSNGAIDTYWNITNETSGAGIDSLIAAGNNMLYGIESPNSSGAGFVKINLSNGNFSSASVQGNAGPGAYWYSSGGMAMDPQTGVYYAAFSNASGSSSGYILNTINTTTGNGTTGSNTDINGMNGLAFTKNGTLWAGSFTNEDLYTINSLATGGNTFRYDLSTSLSGNITSLNNTPEAGTLGLLSIGVLALLLRPRRRMWRKKIT